MISKKVTILILVGVILIILVYTLSTRKGSSSFTQPSATPIQPSSQTSAAENQKPQIISTRPDPLDNAIISADQVIEIGFNRALENVGEFKLRIDPETEYKVELSSDRKVAKIIPTTPFDLGVTYTMFIGPETKFDGVGRWGEEKIFHFRTIRYRGI